ncbi:MAG: carbohydrate kinase, partial [Bacteroidota bacterium]
MTLIFDIGKTHKKCLLFDADYQLIELEEQRFAEIEDEDGFPCDDLTGILRWMEDRLDFFLKKSPAITHLNFSTYGASLVHVDQKGKPLTPLYNYLKPLPADIRKRFYQLYGPAEKLAQE